MNCLFVVLRYSQLAFSPASLTLQTPPLVFVRVSWNWYATVLPDESSKAVLRA